MTVAEYLNADAASKARFQAKVSSFPSLSLDEVSTIISSRKKEREDLRIAIVESSRKDIYVNGGYVRSEYAPGFDLSAIMASASSEDVELDSYWNAAKARYGDQQRAAIQRAEAAAAAAEAAAAQAAAQQESLAQARLRNAAPFKDSVRVGMTQDEIITAAKTFAQTKNYFDNDVLETIRYFLSPEEVAALTKVWVKNVTAWDINPNNPDCMYKPQIYPVFSPNEDRAFKPGKTITLANINKALKFLGGETFWIRAIDYGCIDEHTYANFVTVTLPGIEEQTYLAGDYNKAIKMYMEQLGLDGFIPWKYPVSLSYHFDASNIKNDSVTAASDIYDKRMTNFGLRGNQFGCLQLEETLYVNQPRPSKNFWKQFDAAMPMMGKIFTGIVIGAMTAGLASSALGTSSLGTLVSELVSNKVTPAIVSLAIPNYKPPTIMGGSVALASLSFDTVTPTSPEKNISDSTAKPETDNIIKPLEIVTASVDNSITDYRDSITEGDILKTYTPYIVGGLSLLILLKILSPRPARI